LRERWKSIDWNRSRIRNTQPARPEPRLGPTTSPRQRQGPQPPSAVASAQFGDGRSDRRLGDPVWLPSLIPLPAKMERALGRACCVVRPSTASLYRFTSRDRQRGIVRARTKRVQGQIRTTALCCGFARQFAVPAANVSKHCN
jgi:hypothetical protein